MDIKSEISGKLIARAYSWKENTNLFKNIKKLEMTQWSSFEEIKKKQLIKLRNILIHAFETVEYYKEIFIKCDFNPYNFLDFEQIKDIPVLTKKDINHNRNRMISIKYDINRLEKGCTGGSTGTQLHFYINKESVDIKNACAWRHNKWAGWDIGVPVAAIWGNPKIAKTLKQKIRRKILNRNIVLDTMNMTEKTMFDFCYEIRKLKNYIIYGHSHSIYIFANFCKDNGISIRSPKGIVSTSMMLMENERNIIENVFKQKVTDRYGCEEVSLIGSECEKHDGMHLNLDHLIIEFIKNNGEKAKSGEEGKIIVTDLTNFGMPFIRYEVGDVGIPSDRICGCGRGLPLMEKVIGRTADFLRRKDNSLVAGVSLIERLLTKIPGIYQMQIVQDKVNEIELKIVKGRDFCDDITMIKLRKEFGKAFPGTKLMTNFVDKIEQERSGKYRFAICNI